MIVIHTSGDHVEVKAKNIVAVIDHEKYRNVHVLVRGNERTIPSYEPKEDIEKKISKEVNNGNS